MDNSVIKTGEKVCAVLIRRDGSKVQIEGNKNAEDTKTVKD